MTNCYKLICMLPIGATALFANGLSPASVSPEDYGIFKATSKTDSPFKLQAFSEGVARKGGLSKLSAYANEGNAEVDKIGTLTLVEQEDFSLLTTGTEENPDYTVDLEISQWLLDEEGNFIFDENGNLVENPEYEYPWNNMKREYISGDKGWGIGNAYPAGGCLYFPFSMSTPQGKISTPWLDLSANAGTFVLEFKVKVSADALADSTMPPAIIVETAETRNMGPTWDTFEESFVNYENLSEEWTTFRLVYQGAGVSTLCNIVGQGVSGGMYIDDIKIYSLTPYLATPVLGRHTDFTETSFVLNWNQVDGAEKYIVNVWYDDLYGERILLADNVETAETSYKVEGTNLDDIYFCQVQAVNSEHSSLQPLPREVFDIVTPKMRKAQQVGIEGNLFEGGVEEVVSAYGYDYYATARRVAEQDGPFVVTNETFTGWRHPLYEDGEEYTKENPAEDKIASLYFPTDINQQGWYGENFQIYKDYICLVPFFYEASLHQEQTAWVSPELDLSKDGGKVSVSMKLAAEFDINFETYSYCIVGLFNWNDDKGDYDQVELVYLKDLNFDWQDRSIELTKGTSRSKIAFFGAGSYGDLYIDDIVISQNYKAGDMFDDPFYFSTWQLSENMTDPTTFEFEVPAHALGHEIYQKAQAVRIHLDSQGGYDGEVKSPFAESDFVASTVTGVNIVENSAASKVNVSGGVIYVANPDGLTVSVCGPDGRVYGLGNGENLAFTPDAKGVYVVTIGGGSVKIAL